MFISIVTPVYRCSDSIDELYARLTKTLPHISNDYEIIFVNDGSPDNAWEKISLLAKIDNKVKGINLSRNFGQHNAIIAGLEHTKGEWVVVMDCDMQDMPEEISNLYKKCMEGFDIVLARRKNRKDNFLIKTLSKAFYKILSYLTETHQEHTIANFGIYKKPVINSLKSMGDYNKYFPTMIRWVGFKTAEIDVIHSKRESGKSSYNLKNRINLSIDVILSFSNKPLKLMIKLGFFFSLASLILAIYFVCRYFIVGIAVSGWTSLIISIWFLSGLIIFMLGILGLYIGKTFDKVKNRPNYIISDAINID